MLIDIEDFTDNAMCLVLAKTGVKYTAQVGGVGCSHPEKEGYLLSLGTNIDFDSCSYGCAYLTKYANEDPKAAAGRNRLGFDFDVLCVEYFKGCKAGFRFDFDRVDETMEGWLPIKFHGKYNSQSLDGLVGFFFNGNCD